MTTDSLLPPQNTSTRSTQSGNAMVVSFSQAVDIIKGGLDIIDVIGRHVVLKKSGKNHQGLCPFHNEKSPSFNVNAERQFFKCFGCGESGDALTFLMKVNNQSFGELIAELAKDYGIQLERSHMPSNEEKQEQEKLLDILNEAARYYRDQLEDHTTALEYLQGRKLNYQLQTQWQIGAAPAGWRQIKEALAKRITAFEVTDELLEKAGLVIKKEDPGKDPSVYDRFRNRLMIPICNDKGQVVAFGARTLSADDNPKYLNSPETPLYIKHQVLYGLHAAKSAIAQHQSVVVMEGYFDVLSSVQKGLQHCVGVCGTALSEQHLKLLKRYGAKTIYLCLDSDTAGQNAIVRTLVALQNKAATLGVELRVVQLPDGKDPDVYFATHSLNDFETQLAQSMDGWQFEFAQVLKPFTQLDDISQRVDAASQLVPVLLRIEKPVLRYEWIRQLAGQIGVSEQSLAMEVEHSAQKSANAAYNSYGDKKNYSNQAISPFSSRLQERTSKTPSSLPSQQQGWTKRWDNNRSGNKAKGPRPLEVREEVNTLRRHLANRTTLAYKEAQLLSHAFMTPSTFNTLAAELADAQLGCPLAAQLSAYMQQLAQPVVKTQQELNERIQQLQKVILETDTVNPGGMLSYLSDRVFEADTLLGNLVPLRKQGDDKAPKGLSEHDLSVKLSKIVQTLLASLQLNQHKLALGQLLSELKDVNSQNQQAPLDVQTQLTERLHSMLTSSASGASAVTSAVMAQLSPPTHQS